MIGESPADRLLVALLFALVVHTALILGIRFELPTPPQIDPALDVELIKQPADKPPPQANYRSQADSRGSHERQERPTKPLAARSLLPRPALKAEGRAHDRHPPSRLTQPQFPASQPDSPPEVMAEPHLDRNLLAQQIAELDAMAPVLRADLEERIVPIQQVNAYKHIAAAYERAWQDKVERVGNLNYPDEARRQGLSGALVVSVWVAKDGQVRKIRIHRSSGHPLLDEAALRIVRLAAPFAPFPVELANQADEIVITRTWKFYDESGLAMGR